MIDQWDLKHVGRGLLMGGADIVPGVSGGTIALILGIYQRLVTAISHFDLTFVRLLRERRFGDAASHADLRFLVALAAGIGTGIIGLASLMHHLLDHHMQTTFAAFFGMIAASSWMVARHVGGWTPGAAATAIAAAGFAFWLVGLPFLDNPPRSLLWVFACGMVAICAMILPGISGAFILLILGEYYEVTGVLKSIASGSIDGRGAGIVGAFGAGAAIGLVSFSKLLRWLLGAHRTVTMAALTGFMLGSLRKIWPFKLDRTPTESDFKLKQFENVLPDWSAGATWLAIAIALGGFVAVLALERLSSPARPKPA